MREVKIQNAFHESSGRTINIAAARKGKACGCTCFACGGKLIAVKKNIAWHFRHDTESTCSGGPETALHQLAKQIIADKLWMNVPRYGHIGFSNAVVEKEYSSFRPDVTAEYKNKKIFFEVVVTHFSEPDKRQFFTEQECFAIEINLRGLKLDARYEEVENEVLNELNNKEIICWGAEAEPMETVEQPVTANLLSWILSIGLLIFLYKSLFRKRSREMRFRYA